MKITEPLDRILNNEAKVKILRFLCKTNAEWNGRQIAKEIRVTPATTHKALQGLNKEGVLLLRNMGKTHVYSLKHGSYIVDDILRPLFEKENKVLGDITRTIMKGVTSSGIRKDIISVALFGSVNIKEDRPASDIDLAIIVRHRRDKPKADALVENINGKISAKFGNVISPYINSEAEFKGKYKRGLEVIKNIIKSNRLIYGKEIGSVI